MWSFLTAPKLLMMISCTHFLILSMISESHPLISNDDPCQSLIFMLHLYPFEYGPCHLLFYSNMSSLAPWAQPSGYLEQIHPFQVVTTVGYIPGILLTEHPHIPSPTNATVVPLFTVLSLHALPLLNVL